MSTFTGTWRLVRLGLRRERVMLPVWLLGLSGLTAAIASAITELYRDDPASGAAASAANPVVRIFNGPASGGELGALVAAELHITMGIIVALISIVTVVRHTRQEEETGRAELVGAAAVGRHAGLTAALLIVAGANLVFAVSVTVVLAAYGLPVAGAAVTGVALGAVGATFGALAAVTAQISATQRSATLLAVAGLGVAFLLRAVGDALGHVADGGMVVVSAWPSWLSPIGWGSQARPFHQDNWQVFGLFAVLLVGLVTLAFRLTDLRDVGAGMMSPRPGPRRAPAALLRPFGLAWRLQRPTLLGWLVALAVLGFAMGALGDSLEGVGSFSDELARIGGGATFREVYIAFLMGLFAVAVAAYAVQALLRLRAEEAAGRLEPLLAAPVARARWLVGHALIAGVGAVAALAAVGASGMLGYWLATGDVAAAATLLGAALVQGAAVLVLAGLTVAGFGLFPRLAVAVSWAAVAVSLLMGQFGELLELPRAVLNLSPFTHVPAVPAEEFTVSPLVVQLVAALGLVGLGLLAFRRRDLAISG